MNKLTEIEKLIDEINKLHLAYSQDYFDTGKVKSI